MNILIKIHVKTYIILNAIFNITNLIICGNIGLAHRIKQRELRLNAYI